MLEPPAAAAGPEWVVPRTMRHTLGSWVLDGGVTNPASSQTQMRHANLKQTINFYLHDTSDNAGELAELATGSRDVHRTFTRKATGKNGE